MYEKKINIFNKIDRELMVDSFKYNVTIFTILLIIISLSFFIKKKFFYQNTINYVDNKNAILLVDKQNINIVKEYQELIINNLSMNYNIDTIEENDNYYLVKIHFDIEINSKALLYKIMLQDETLIKYIIRIIKGG